MLSAVGEQLAEVEILSEDDLAPVPRAVREQHAYWGSWAYKTFDPGSLAHLARTAYAAIAPEVVHTASAQSLLQPPSSHPPGCSNITGERGD